MIKFTLAALLLLAACNRKADQPVRDCDDEVWTTKSHYFDYLHEKTQEFHMKAMRANGNMRFDSARYYTAKAEAYLEAESYVLRTR